MAQIEKPQNRPLSYGDLAAWVFLGALPVVAVVALMFYAWLFYAWFFLL
jgi:hypothetical protein